MSTVDILDVFHQLTTVQLVEWIGSLLGLLGSALLAANVKISRYGWVVFLFSNAFLIAFSVSMGLQGLLTMQIGFALTSSLGVYRAFLSHPRGSASQPTSN